MRRGSGRMASARTAPTTIGAVVLVAVLLRRSSAAVLGGSVGVLDWLGW